MDFLKEFPASDFHPQMRKAGFWGATVFRALCRMSARHDLDGEIPPQYQDSFALAEILKADEYEMEIQAGLARCVEVGLLRKEDLGNGHGEVWIIDGWSSLYTEKHKTNAERRELWKERKRIQRELAVAKSAESIKCPTVSRETTGTSHLSSMSPLLDKTRHDETRRDETYSSTANSAADSAVLELKPSPSKKVRKPSSQEILAGNLASLRAERLGPDALPDTCSFSRLNKILAPLLEVEPSVLLTAYGHFLDDEYAGGCDPPYPLSLFAAHWPKYVSKATKESA